MMKVLLISSLLPTYYSGFEYAKEVLRPPMGLAYLASSLEANGFEIKIMEGSSTKSVFLQQIRAYLEMYEPNIVGVDSYTSSIGNVFDIVNICKNTNPNIITIVGGVHATVLPERTLAECENIDVVMRKESELTLVDFCFKIQNNLEFYSVPNITYRRHGKIVNNPDSKAIENLDRLPFPAYHLLKMDAYKEAFPYKGIQNFMYIFTSRGCPFKCIFCSANIICGRKIRRRSPKNVVDEIEMLISKYDIKYFYVADSTFTQSKEHCLAICNEIIERKLKIIFKCQSRVDAIDKEILMKLKEAGCVSITFGIESGSQKILDDIRKKITIKQIEDAIEKVKKVGIICVTDFMIGHITDTHETIKKTIEFAVKLNADYAVFSIATPFPGSEMYDIVKKEGYLKNDDWENFSFYHAGSYEHPNLSNSEIDQYQKEAWRRFYLRPRKIFEKIWGLFRIRDYHFFKEELRLNIIGVLTIIKMNWGWK